MKIAVLSDIHANPGALMAVYEDTVDQDVERFWFLGDAVGYGPDPVAALKWLAHMVEPEDWVLGNHEAIMANLLTNEERQAVGSVAREVCDYHRRQIQLDEATYTFYLNELNETRIKPLSHHINGINHILTHAGQHARHLFRYIYPWQTDVYLPLEFDWLFRQHRQSENRQIQWFGHTHVPTLIYGYLRGDKVSLESVPILSCQPYSLTTAPLIMINPGSVGQPRDLDHRAAYALLDTEKQELTFRRVAYDWRETLYELEKLSLSADTFRNLEDRLRDAEPDRQTPPRWRTHYEKACGITCTDEL
jgi:predicted phosphodiesterase